MRHSAKAVVADRRRARDEALMEVRMMSLGRQKQVVEELAAERIQAATRGSATRRAMASMSAQRMADNKKINRDTAPTSREETGLNEAATAVQAVFRGASSRSRASGVPSQNLIPHRKIVKPKLEELERSFLAACASGDLQR